MEQNNLYILWDNKTIKNKSIELYNIKTKEHYFCEVNNIPFVKVSGHSGQYF